MNMEKKPSRLELKCQMKTFIEKQPFNERYNKCYKCDGYVNLPCYVEPIKSDIKNGMELRTY